MLKNQEKSLESLRNVLPKEMVFRRFQVREFSDGTYSVIYNLDLPKDKTEVYENKKLINMTQEDATIKARLMEEQYKDGKLIVDTKDSLKWEYIYTL